LRAYTNWLVLPSSKVSETTVRVPSGRSAADVAERVDVDAAGAELVTADPAGIAAVVKGRRVTAAVKAQARMR
jgi:hypothetical protein